MDKRHRRWPSEARIVVERGEDAVPASVNDVSEGGLKIRSASLDAAPGDPIVIRAGRLRAVGEVRWKRGNAFGLSFRPSLESDMLAHLTGGLYRANVAAGSGRGQRGKARGPGLGHLHTM